MHSGFRPPATPLSLRDSLVHGHLSLSWRMSVSVLYACVNISSDSSRPSSIQIFFPLLGLWMFVGEPQSVRCTRPFSLPSDVSEEVRKEGRRDQMPSSLRTGLLSQHDRGRSVAEMHAFRPRIGPHLYASVRDVDVDIWCWCLCMVRYFSLHVCKYMSI